MKEGNDESGVCVHTLSVPYIWFPALHWPRPWTSWAVRWRVFGAQLRPGGRKAKRRRPLPRTGIIEQPSEARTWASPEPRAQSSDESMWRHLRSTLCPPAPGCPRGHLDGLATASSGRDRQHLLWVSSGSWTRRDGRPGRSRWAAQCSALRSGGLSLSGGCKWAVWRPHWRRSQARLARPGVGGVEGGPHVQARALGPGPLWTRPSLGCRPCFLPSFLAIAMDAQPVAGRHLAQIFTVSRRLPLAGGGCVGSRRCGLGRAIQPWHRGGPRLPQWRRVARPVTAMST